MPKTKEELEVEKTALLDEINQKATDAAKAAIEAFKTDYIEIAKKAAEGTYSKEEVDVLLKGLEDKSTEFDPQTLIDLKESIDKINVSQKEQGRLLNEKFTLPSGSVKKGFGDILKDALEEAGFLEEYVVDPNISQKMATRIKNYEIQSKGQAAINLKAAIDMTSPLALRPGDDPGTNIGFLTDYSMMDVLENISKDVHMVNVLPTDPTTGQYIGVIIESDYVDGTGVTAENTAAGQSSIKFSTKEFKVFDIPTSFKVSLNMLADIDRLVSKLNRIAPDKTLSAFDKRILSATGDNDTDIKGMFVAGNFTDFDATVYQDTIKKATLLDLVRKMKLQATLDDQDVNAVFLHPSSVDSVEGFKDADENFLNSRGIVYDKQGNLIRIHGLAVAKNKKIGTNACVVMWNEAAEIGIREDINFEIGTDGNDLSKRMRTIIFYFRAAFGVGKAAGIIYSDDMTADIAIINKEDA